MAEQELNSVDRFRKKSAHLVLEEHGHCEVPAGCGGVVLRWRNPYAAQSVVICMYTPETAATFLDGQPLNATRVDLSVDQHVFAFQLVDVVLNQGLLLFVAVGEHQESGVNATSLVSERTVQVRSTADGSWKYCLEMPATDEWLSAAFVDANWRPLVAHPTPQLPRGQKGSYQCNHCAEQGAICLGLPPGEQPYGRGTIWIRKVFDVSVPQRVDA
jgi:hypothetical protein